MGITHSLRPKMFGHNFEGEMELFILTPEGLKSEKKMIEEKKAEAEQRRKIEAEKAERQGDR